MTAYPRPGVLYNYVMETYDCLFHLFIVHVPFSRQCVICALLEIKTGHLQCPVLYKKDMWRYLNLYALVAS